jgi:hypothetical protein
MKLTQADQIPRKKDGDNQKCLETPFWLFSRSEFFISERNSVPHSSRHRDFWQSPRIEAISLD